MPITDQTPKRRISDAWKEWNGGVKWHRAEIRRYKTTPAIRGMKWTNGMIRYHERLLAELQANEPEKYL